MKKIGFEMGNEERALTLLDTTLDISLAVFTEGFTNSVLAATEKTSLENLLMDASKITSNALDRFQEEK